MNAKDNKREAAKILFMEGLSQEDITKILGVAPNTLTRWKTADNWSERRIQKQLHENSIADKIRRKIAYELELDENFIEQEMKKPIADRKRPEKGQADSLLKLHNMIKNDELKFESYIKVSRQILLFVQEEDIELAKSLDPVLNRFINEARKKFD